MIEIKVLQNNFNKEVKDTEEVKKKIKYPIKTSCDQCDSKLEVSEEDIHIGWLGAGFVTCPCCGEESMVDEVEGITLTIDNIEFPVHFLHTKFGERHCKDISNEEIENDIRKGIEHFRRNKDVWYWYTMYGDMAMFIHRLEGDKGYSVYVTKDYYETDIPFENADYDWSKYDENGEYIDEQD